MKRKASFSEEIHAKKKGSIESFSNGARTLTSFASLLNFSDQDDIGTRFDDIAEEIFLRLVLVLQSGSKTVAVFEVLELEFYLWMAGFHEDPFTHRAAEQSESGRWYFHRVPQKSESRKSSVGGGYRGGSRKGLDLTVGQSTIVSSPYFSTGAQPSRAPTKGGILLRTLRNTSTGNVISGPSLVVDEILDLSRAPSISNLVHEQWMGNISAFRGDDLSSAENTSVLYFKPRTDVRAKHPRPHIYQSPRIGLDLSHSDVSPTPTHPRIIYLTKPYRYFTHPKLLTSNGRPQTFLGILFSLDPRFASSGTSQNKQEMAMVKTRICEQSGMKIHTVAKYLEYFLAGSARSDLESFTGPNGKHAAASPATYLQLMGMLFDEQVGKKL